MAWNLHLLAVPRPMSILTVILDLSMGLLPPRRWRIAILALLLLGVLWAVPISWIAELKAIALLVTNARVHDNAGVITLGDEWRFERYLAGIADESGVDVQILIVPSIRGESLEAFGVRQARALNVGQGLDRRGLLVVYDTSARQLRLEVGAQLEGMITDAFAGYLMRHHVRSFFGTGTPTLGLRTTLMMVQHRLREAALGQGYDPSVATQVEDLRRLALGGGASAGMPVVTAGEAFLNRAGTSPRAVRQYFAPQPTPAAAHARYLEWLARGRWEADVPLFTPSSQEYLATLTMTDGYNDHLLQIELGEPSDILERDSLAVQYFTSSPLAVPHFYRRTGGGWTMDIVAEVLDTRNYVGGAWTWGLLDSGDDFTATFQDQWVGGHGFYRFAGGDNRPIPTRAHAGHGPRSGPLAPLPPARSVTEAAAEIETAGSGPVVVLFYGTWSEEARAELPVLVRITRTCRDAGARILAYTTDHELEPLRRVADTLRAYGAPFTPVRLLPWAPGRLMATMAPLGIRVGQRWRPPILAVRRDGQVRAQGEDDEIWAQAEAFAAACQP